MSKFRPTGVLMTEFLKDWQAFIKGEYEGLNSIDLAERFWMLGRYSVLAEFDVDLKESEQGYKIRLNILEEGEKK